MSAIQIAARELPNYIGANVVGHGLLRKAGLIPGGDFVIVEFGDGGFNRQEATFPPDEILTVETSDR